ncbi:DgyrCDS11536 [Dimorphilus gyrociliatus]|nr:DgyrCDS11536 [Dimorphilus gyrociliatus]
MEMKQKIDEFIKSKRRKVNLLNRKEFCDTESEENQDGCARTCSIVKKLENNKSHIKVERVYNEIGPQNIHSDREKEMYNQESEKNTLLERIENMENQLLLFNDKRRSCHIYERIQDLESRIVKLEETNPEYRVLLKEECSTCLNNRKKNFLDKQELLKEIDERINSLKDKISSD